MARQEPLSFRIGQIFVTFLLTCFAWIFFRASSIIAAFDLVKRMFGTFNPWIFFDNSLYLMGLDHSEFNTALVSIIILLIVDGLRKRYTMQDFNRQNIWFRWTVYGVTVLAILLFGVYGADYVQSQFIYFQF